MSAIWEKGDVILERKLPRQALLGREYALRAIESREGPFLEMRLIHEEGGMATILYRGTDCQPLNSFLGTGRCESLCLPLFLHCAEKLMGAIDWAEDQMILPETFEIGADTIFLKGDKAALKLAYIPLWRKCQNQTETKNLDSAGGILRTLLRQVAGENPDFLAQWDFMDDEWEKLQQQRAARGRYLETIQRWRREYPLQL